MVETAGFSAPVHDSARVFRQILEAMARPGRVFRLAETPVPPPPLSPAAAAVALSLVDGDAPAWLAPDLRSPAIDNFLRFHTGAAPTADASRAAFAFGPWAALASQTFSLGSPEYPDRSATLLIAVARLEAGRGVALRGPGIADVHRLDTDLPGDFWAFRAEAAAGFPMGFDVILTCNDSVAALPRTTVAEG